MATATPIIVFCSRCGGEMGYGGICYSCVSEKSTPAVIVNERGMAFSHTITPDMQTEASALADRLEEQDCLADAELVRRLAGLG